MFVCSLLPLEHGEEAVALWRKSEVGVASKHRATLDCEETGCGVMAGIPVIGCPAEAMQGGKGEGEGDGEGDYMYTSHTANG